VGPISIPTMSREITDGIPNLRMRKGTTPIKAIKAIKRIKNELLLIFPPFSAEKSFCFSRYSAIAGQIFSYLYDNVVNI
jgi:hypothetical protein